MAAAAYSYRAAHRDGRIVEGQLQAATRDEALRRVADLGLTPIAVVDAEVHGATVSPRGAPEHPGLRLPWVSARRPTRAELLALSTQLAVMLRAGLTVDGALRLLAGMSQRPALAALVQQVYDEVKRGAPLSRALAGHGEIFDHFYVSMIRSGEASGHLDRALTRVVEHLQRAHSLREKVSSALIYPAILLAVAMLSVVGMLVFVVPQFEVMFRDARAALPLSTAAVMTVSRVMVDHGSAVLGFVLLVLVLALATRSLRAPQRRAWWQAKLRRLPVVGPIVRDYDTAQLMRTLGNLLASGVPILTALGISRDAAGDISLREATDRCAVRVRAGSRLAEALGATGKFEPLAVNLVRVGEETGRLDEMILELARILDDRIELGVKRGLALLEPALIIVLGLFIGAVVAAVLLGILTVNDLAA